MTTSQKDPSQNKLIRRFFLKLQCKATISSCGTYPGAYLQKVSEEVSTNCLVIHNKKFYSEENFEFLTEASKPQEQQFNKAL